MKIAVLSDSRLPSTPLYPGHGLGQLCVLIADGLIAHGHRVTLFGADGSALQSGDCVEVYRQESDLLKRDWSGFDAILDVTHGHGLLKEYPMLPTVNYSVDREAHPGACTIYPSRAHAEWHNPCKGDGLRVVYHGTHVPEYIPRKRGGYIAYLGHCHAAKQPALAVQATGLAGKRLVIAGTTPAMYPTGKHVTYIGPVTGADKRDFLAEADAVIHPASTEAGTLSVIEVQAAGTPIIVSAWGASPEMICTEQGKETGIAVKTVNEAVAALARIADIPGERCAQWVRDNRSVEKMVVEIQQALQERAEGKVW